MTNILERYFGARPFSNLYMAVAVSLQMISLIVSHFRFCIKSLADESNLLLVTILADRFCSF